MSDAAFRHNTDRVNAVKWTALLGRPDLPTDGVADYCAFLAKALAERRIEMSLARVSWMEDGWLDGLRKLWRESAAWQGQWVLLQYTALSWSRRGFPLGAVAVLATLRRRGVRCAVVFHEPDRQGGSGLLQGIRGACQDWVIHKLYEGAAKSIFTVPVETVAWLPNGEKKTAFIPIGANIPESGNRRDAPDLAAREKTVIVFGVTGSPEAAAREVNDISGVMLDACRTVGRLRLVVVGRGALESQELFEKAFHGGDVELVARGVLPAEEIAREFESADALLFVRGAITPRRGSVMAGIASGIPILGYRDGSISGPLEEAGVEWSPWHDQESLTRGLIRVLSDPQRWMELHERNLKVQKNYLSWSRIAERFQEVLAG
jgi:glycosyltransferase involved in cell wall biosynthesis